MSRSVGARGAHGGGGLSTWIPEGTTRSTDLRFNIEHQFMVLIELIHF